MKAKYNYIFVFSLAIIALIINATLFYMPHIRGDYSILNTQDERLLIYLKGGDYLEIFWDHDFWQSTENEYDSLIKGQPQRKVSYHEDWLTNQKTKILEIIENEDIQVTTKLKIINSQSFSLERSYKIKNEYLLEDMDTTYIQLIIGSDFHSYTPEENRLNFTHCKLTINKPNILKSQYHYQNSLLEVSRQIPKEAKENNTYTIKLNFYLDCE